MENLTSILITTISTVLGCAGTWFIANRKQKVDDAQFVTGEWKKLYDTISNRVDQLEKKNIALEAESERSKKQERVCQETLAIYDRKIKELEKKISG